MATLTYTAYISRKIIKFGGVGVLGIVIIYWFFGLVWAAYLAANPPYMAPTVRFGVLPKIIFSEKAIAKKDFSLELPNDTFPEFKDQTNVYVIYRSKSVIGALEEAKKTAELINFRNAPTEVSTGVYRFDDPTTGKNLVMNVLGDSFKLSYDYLNDQSLLNPGNMPSNAEAISQAKAFLSQAGKLYKDLDEGTTKVTLWKIGFGALAEVKGLTDANIIRVDFFRNQLNGERNIVSESLDKSSVSVLLSGSTEMAKKILEVNYKYVNVDDSAPSTYPIKTAQTAFNDMKSGYYWPAVDVPASAVTVRKVSLAYFEPITPVQFLQPVYVFEGDGGFVGYVPAVTDKYTK
ncbi:MAG: hypothetical protein WC069_02870 [Candidatus Shapirobacteria bacterium]